MNIYKIPNSIQTLIITDNVLDILDRFRQTGNKPEFGGLVFARLDELPNIILEKISTPHVKDRCERFFFCSYKKAQKKLIQKRFKQNLHFIGEWHSHPQTCPTPSSLDLQTMKNSFLFSEHQLNYFLMLIIGTANNSLWISLHNNKQYLILKK